MMISSEPINLTEWRSPATTLQGKLFTCGRPGRATFGRSRSLVDDSTIDNWIKGLPKAEVLHIISLLGYKTDCFSEFGYYPFRSSKELGTKPTFQEWLDERYDRRFVVHEFPTKDANGIPPVVLKKATRCILNLIEAGNMIVVVDSAGAERTARVCEAIGFAKE